MSRGCALSYFYKSENNLFEDTCLKPLSGLKKATVGCMSRYYAGGMDLSLTQTPSGSEMCLKSEQKIILYWKACDGRTHGPFMSDRSDLPYFS